MPLLEVTLPLELETKRGGKQQRFFNYVAIEPKLGLAMNQNVAVAHIDCKPTPASNAEFFFYQRGGDEQVILHTSFIADVPYSPPTFCKLGQR